MRPTAILLFGMARSGTSFLGELFKNNPRVSYLFEPFRSLRLSGDDFSWRTEEFTDPGEEAIVEATFRGDAAPLLAADPEIGAWLASHGHRTGPERTLVVAKEIKTNLQVRWLDRFLPPALPFVHIARDPRAIVDSFLYAKPQPPGRGLFGGGKRSGGEAGTLFQHWGWDKPGAAPRVAPEFDGPASLLASADPVDSVCARWVIQVGHAVRDMAHLHGRRCLRIRYEELANDPEGAAARLYQDLELPLPGPVVEWLSDNTRAGKRESRYSTARDSRSMARIWEGRLPGPTVDRVLELCGPLMKELGYAT